MKSLIIGILIIGLVFVGIGCGMNRAQKGAIIGATAGGAVGGAIGNKAGNTAVGAVAGAAVGGVAGGYIGKYMDKQAADIQNEVKSAKVERVGEEIQVTFDSAILFDVDKALVRTDTKANLDKLAGILQKYPDTNLTIAGHTDSTGSKQYNIELSKKRAQSVADYLINSKIDRSRLAVEGFGETKPIAANDTKEGRQANRRVEIAIAANEKLKETAQKETTK